MLSESDENFIEAVRQGDGARAKQSLIAGANPNLAVHSTPLLMIAAMRGHADIVDLILESGGLVDSRDAQRRTALSMLAMVARTETHFRLIDRLIEAGADVNALDVVRVSPIERARQYLNDRVVLRLRQAGAIEHLEARALERDQHRAPRGRT